MSNRASTDEGLFQPPVRSRRPSIVGTKLSRRPPKESSPSLESSLEPSSADEQKQTETQKETQTQKQKENPSTLSESLEEEAKSISMPPPNANANANANANSRKPSMGGGMTFPPLQKEPSFVRPSRKTSLARYVTASHPTKENPTTTTMAAETMNKNEKEMMNHSPPQMSPSRPPPSVNQQTHTHGQQLQQQDPQEEEEEQQTQTQPPYPYNGYGHHQQPNPYGAYYPPPQQHPYGHSYPPPVAPYGYSYGYGYPPPPPPPPPQYGYPPQPPPAHPSQPPYYGGGSLPPHHNHMMMTTTTSHSHDHDNSVMDGEASPALVQMQHTIDTKPVVLFAEDASEGAGRSRVVKKILSNLGVDAHQDLCVYTLDNRSDGHLLAQKLTRMTGYDKTPLLFIGGQCFGDYQAILAQCRNDQLRPKLLDAGISGVVSAIPTTTLEDNIFGYPKALATGQHGGDNTTMNVLIGCAGSSASDKIPELVERCVQQGWSVKLICTNSGEHFFKAFGMERVVHAIGAENIYRDEDEWNFEYERFDMPVRACHLALRKWADVLLVAPVTCNSMAKAAAGIGDNLLTSVFVAWEYHKKPALFCPACNADMWNNFPTQRNVKTLKGMGVEILGPRVARLTNGQVAIGAMELVDDIIARLKEKETTLLSGTEFFFSRAKLAQLEASDDMWDLVLRGVEEQAMDINAQMEENGNTLLHLAAGGESFEENGSITWGAPALGALRKLVDMGAKLNIANNFQFKPLHVAVSCDDVEAVTLLLEAGADATGTLIDFPSVSMQVRSILETKKEASNLATPYYYTYGSLKRGFPNHDDLAKHLMNFKGPATTVKPYPLVIPHEPACNNPNCPYLHQQATLCNLEGKGVPVKGEVFEVTIEDIQKFDMLEGFAGGNVLDNVYTRAIIDVQLEGKGIVKAYVYFTSSSEDAMQLVETGKGKFIGEYLMDMARGDLKPGYSAKKIEKNLKRTNSLRKTIKMSQSFRKTSIKRTSTLSRVPETNSLEMPVSELDGIGMEKNKDSQMAPRRLGASNRRSTIIHQHVNENIGSIQQAINTCNIAAIVMALKSLGVTCSMDEIFSSLKLPTSWVVEQGLTLAQVYHVLTKLCGSSDPSESLASGLNAECYHFDEGIAEFSSFVSFLKESISNSENILIANFNTKIAKDVPNGGGHFSCIAGFKPSTQMVTIADVHPLKYGEKWTCTARQLFDSMVDPDGTVKRARGIIRLSLRTAHPMEHNMEECKQAVSFYDPKYSVEMKDWLSRWGDLPAASYESHLNMGGLSGLGLILSGFLANEDFVALNLPGHVSTDFLTWSLHLSVIDLLSGLVSPLTLMNYARRACEKLDINLKITTEVADTMSPDDVFTWFDNRIGPSHSAAALVLLDINEAFGTNLRKTDVGSEAAVLDHGAQHWCCIVATSNNNEVIIADPCAKMMTRLWKCNKTRLRSALLRAEKDPGRVIILGNVPMEN